MRFEATNFMPQSGRLPAGRLTSSALGRAYGCVMILLNLAAVAQGADLPGTAIESAAVTAEPSEASHAEAPDDLLANARFSMELRGAPLSRMLSLLEVMTPVRFRYGAPPDALVTTSAQDVPLFPTLDTLLNQVGFQTQRAGGSVFLFRAAPQPPLVPTSSSALRVSPNRTARPAARGTQRKAGSPLTWSYWTGSGPPPADWMAPQTLPQGMSAGTPSRPRSADDWRPADVALDAARRPGVIVTVTPRRQATVDKTHRSTAVWLRWPMVLRNVPRGAQLMLETPAEATLYVNGAPLVRRWKGQRSIDLGQVLQPGSNCLAMHWSDGAGATPLAAMPAGAGPETAPGLRPSAMSLLRYEWFFVSKFDDAETPGTPGPQPVKPNMARPNIKLNVTALGKAPPRRRRR